ncbi:MAG: hypothetical protein AAB637_00735 [Patescibacteria group bacterium]
MLENRTNGMKIITRITKNDFAPFTSSETCIKYRNGIGDEFIGVVKSLTPKYKWGKAVAISIEYTWLIRVRKGEDKNSIIPIAQSLVKNRTIEFPNPQLVRNGQIMEFSSGTDKVELSTLEKDLIFSKDSMKEYKRLAWEDYLS